ncbi:hypothetical protein EYZ11_004308 [Aspergillus tanneri]|uniref:FAD-binding domain-containing protein n=1 Tax=Aspergillus tanneri TaxID=1220188 RepID=A0A4S3JLH1_9EURO|nr:hypothetical protein EYZ11_004308 [Aspergillus tanneri]
MPGGRIWQLQTPIELRRVGCFWRVIPNIPTGGYGMNTGLGDAFDIGWKLAAVLNGHGGEHLLASYEAERRPVALRNVERSAVHARVHSTYRGWVAAKGNESVVSETEEARKLKKDITDFVREQDGENKEHGIEMGYHFPNSPVVTRDAKTREDEKASEWPARVYTPSTAPGRRAPHVYLRDNEISIHDLFGKDYTIIDLTLGGEISRAFEEAALRLKIPLNVVLVRPDGFVSWRSEEQDGEHLVPNDYIENILLTAVGQRSAV